MVAITKNFDNFVEAFSYRDALLSSKNVIGEPVMYAKKLARIKKLQITISCYVKK